MKIFYLDSLFNFSIININRYLFDCDFIIFLIYKYILFYNFNLRTSCSVQKNRSIINYSSRKLYKQKGTGKSRVGSISSPTRRKGGRSFPGFSYENYNCKINKYLYKKSLIIIFSQFFLQSSIFIVEDFFFINIKTSKFFKKNIKSFFLFYSYKFILLTFFLQKSFFYSIKNLFSFNFCNIFKFNPIFLLKFSKVLITRSSFKFLIKLLLWFILIIII